MTTTELRPFDAAEYLDTPEAALAYLEYALAEDDPAFFLKALGVAARSKGMSEISRTSGLSRPSLYRALDEDGRPEFSTVVAVLKSLGLRLNVKLASAE